MNAWVCRQCSQGEEIKLRASTKETAFSSVKQHRANSFDCGRPHCHLEPVLRTSLQSVRSEKERPRCLWCCCYSASTDCSSLQRVPLQMAIWGQVHYMKSPSNSSIICSILLPNLSALCRHTLQRAHTLFLFCFFFFPGWPQCRTQRWIRQMSETKEDGYYCHVEMWINRRHVTDFHESFCKNVVIVTYSSVWKNRQLLVGINWGNMVCLWCDCRLYKHYFAQLEILLGDYDCRI